MQQPDTSPAPREQKQEKSSSQVHFLNPYLTIYRAILLNSSLYQSLSVTCDSQPRM